MVNREYADSRQNDPASRVNERKQTEQAPFATLLGGALIMAYLLLAVPIGHLAPWHVFARMGAVMECLRYPGVLYN